MTDCQSADAAQPITQIDFARAGVVTPQMAAFAAAEDLGLHAEHALALPGRCAPQTAGALIAQTVLAILEERDPDERSTAP